MYQSLGATFGTDFRGQQTENAGAILKDLAVHDGAWGVLAIL